VKSRVQCSTDKQYIASIRSKYRQNYKTRHILLSNGANYTVLCAVVLTQYRRVTDRRTDGIAVANTALAMRALRAL